MYQWIITSVYPEHGLDIDEIGTRGGVTEPSYPIDVMREEGERFRMLDDDKNVYYAGWIMGDYEGFEPLDDFGTPNAGCTEIQYFNRTSKQWETL